MDAPSQPSERTRELAALRSRAYGPDADIDRDADALARLIQLEELARATAPADSPAPAASPAPHGASASDTSPAPEAPARRAWWRRVPAGAYICGAAVLGVSAGLLLPGLLPPRPATTLEQAPLDGAQLDFQMYGIDADTPVRYEPFHDLEVWSAVTDQGSLCVVVTKSAEWMTAGCAPAPLNPTADITYYPGMRPIEGLELANGSVVRFVLRDGVMDVYIAATEETA